MSVCSERVSLLNFTQASVSKKQMIFVLIMIYEKILIIMTGVLQWGAADAEIKVPSVEHAELKGSLHVVQLPAG